jgi:hypothetical protein
VISVCRVCRCRSSAISRASFLAGDDAELDTGLGDTVEAEDLDGDGGPGFLEAAAVLIDEGAHLAVVVAAEDDVAEAQGALADEDGGDGPSGFFTRTR